jgi:hypothetical protein
MIILKASVDKDQLALLSITQQVTIVAYQVSVDFKKSTIFGLNNLINEP